MARLSLGATYQLASATAPARQRDSLLQQAVSQYEAAIAAGSDVAMLELARMLISGLAGEQPDTITAVALLEQASELGNNTASLMLADLYLREEPLGRDEPKARALVLRAAENDSVDAKLAYAPLLASDESPQLDSKALGWLEELAASKNVRGTMLLATLKAQGNAVPQDLKQARNLYRRAAENSDDPDVINEVAWTLTVSQNQPLRDHRRALKIMTKMMNASDRARRNPAFLDTWAAAYAANGNFKQALTLQREALVVARQQNREDIIEILTECLAAFEAKQTISEDVP